MDVLPKLVSFCFVFQFDVCFCLSQDGGHLVEGQGIQMVSTGGEFAQVGECNEGCTKSTFTSVGPGKVQILS